MNLAEVGPTGVISLPAFAHQVVNFTWTIYRNWQQNLLETKKEKNTLAKIMFQRESNFNLQKIFKNNNNIERMKSLIKSRYTFCTSFVFKLKKMSNLRVVFSFFSRPPNEKSDASRASNGKCRFRKSINVLNWMLCVSSISLFSLSLPTHSIA